MADVQEYVARFAQVIGPRPAGTEEEQQASFFIDEVFNNAGLETSTEEFRCNLSYRVPRVILCMFAIILGALSIFLPMMVLPAFLICLITAILFALDCLELSPFANSSKKGISQNIVAKYEPPLQNGAGGARAQRRRKIILVANYDSGKIHREYKSSMIGALKIIHWFEFSAMILIPVALLIRLVSGENAGPLVMFTNVLTVVGAIGALLVILSYVSHQSAAYNDGANCNASGVAVMLEVARLISASRNAKPQSATVHNSRDAYAAGVVPDGAELVYADELDELDFEENDAASIDINNAEVSSPEDIAAFEANAEVALPGSTIGIADAIPSLAVDIDDGSAVAVATDVEMSSISAAAPASVPASVPVDIPAVSAEATPAPSVSDINAQNAAAAVAARHAASAQAATAVRVAEAAEAAAEIENAAAEAMDAAMHAQSAVDEFYNLAVPVFESVNKEKAVPDWYKRAMDRAAHPPATMPDPSIRSKFSDALDAAVAASHPEPEPIPSGLSSDAEQRLQAMRETIMSGRPLSEATGVVEGSAGVSDSGSSLEDAGAGEDTSAQNTKDPSTTGSHLQGVDGYLSSTMSSATYESSQAVDAVAQSSKTVISEVQAASAAAKPAPEPRKKRSILLPSLTGALQAITAKDIANSKKGAGAEQGAQDTEAEVASIAKRNADKLRKAALSAKLPSLDSTAAGSANLSGATGSLEPITPEEQAAAALSSTAPAAHTQFNNSFVAGRVADMSADMSGDEIYVDDVDDIGYVNEIAEFGATAAAGHVEMPKSRRERMFGKLRRKGKQQDDMSFSAAVGIEEGYDARQIGKDRGDWSSFREDGLGSHGVKTTHGSRGDNEFDNTAWEDDDWSGGAWSGTWGVQQGAPYDAQWSGGAYDAFDDEQDAGASFKAEIREDIRNFHDGPVQLEVWFVALGAELANNAGMKAFIDMHDKDLRGAMIIDIEALGAGELTMVEREGTYRETSMSSRLKRYVHKAGSALGIRVNSANMVWRNSAAYVAERHGCQTLHLAGFKNGKPAYMAEAADTVSHVDAQLMKENAAFLVELIRGI